MASCCDPNSERKASSDSKTASNPSPTGSSLFSFVSPVASALLHSSCCWLPTLLDAFSIGSASASQFQSLRPFFFWVTLLILAESVRRNGLNRRTFYRIAISGFFLAITHGVLVRGLVLRREQVAGRRFTWTKDAYNFRSKHTLPSTSPGVEKSSSDTNRQCQNSPPTVPSSPLNLSFWKSRSIWKRAMLNTTRCLIGCTIGDFSAMWFLQAYYPDLGVGYIMGVAMASGIASSMTLETVLLHLGRDKLGWAQAFKTAAGMSTISMLSMEAVQNVVDYHLTGGVVALSDPYFWGAAGVSMAAGFLAPLPYNYIRLRKYGKACH
ncbi:hypothetical protein EMPG_10286 [Blastomyces silverae]|uniref:DUF4396 domain-containing protein n=1 Tax=Blastomyces silverae TaxID=2060906 RepID=A0A0H1B5R9_9EURO|nr:hypothetical protein EMPG_10286 [Blastomyces silverae]